MNTHPSFLSRYSARLLASLAIAAAAVLATRPAQAEVFIHRGVEHSKGGIVTGFLPSLVSVFGVMDSDQPSLGIVSLVRPDGEKKFGKTGIMPLKTATAPQAKGFAPF